MNKKLINEDIANMRYLFGYKPGRVISEQDIDYTTDDYLDTTEIDEEGKRHPERQVRHKETNKIVGSHKKGSGFTPTSQGKELGFEFHPTDIPHETRLAGTEIGDFDYEDDDFISKMSPYDDEEMEEGYKYDDVDETNPDDVEDDVFGDFDLSQLGLDDEEDMENGEELYPSFSSDEEFLGMSKPNGDMDTEDEDNLFEQEEPENDRYMFFSNLQQIHRQMGILLEKDPEMIHNILENGHDWAQDHIATAKESIDQVFDFIMNEENGDDNEEMFESHEKENNETLRKQLHTLVGNEIKLGKKADMSGADHHKEDHKKVEKELKDFLKDNPSMKKYQDEVEEHFYKKLFG